jgi:hypothetical protein
VISASVAVNDRQVDEEVDVKAERKKDEKVDAQEQFKEIATDDEDSVKTALVV